MSCGCPKGYSVNQSTGLCEKLVRVDADLASEPVLPVQICTSEFFNKKGTAFYPVISSDQFPLTGKAGPLPRFLDALGVEITPSVYLVSGDLWIGGKKDKGRLNQAGIGLLPPTNDWQGYVSCVNVKEGDVYSVAISSSFGFRIYIDRVLAVWYVPLPPVSPADYLHVFNFSLSEGLHNIIFEGLSGYIGAARTCLDQYGASVDCSNPYAKTPPENCPNLGVLVGEIYKNITAQILADTHTQNQLNVLYASRFVNSQKQYITTLLMSGSPTDTGVNGNYVCEAGFISGCVEGKMQCDSVDVKVPGACCFTLVNCVTGETIVTTTDLDIYSQKIVRIGGEECYVINTSTVSGCPGAVDVTVSAYFDNCADCTRKYYRLIDCSGVLEDLVTYTDLSEYVNKVVLLQGKSSCWMISTNVPSVVGAIAVVVSSSYDNCQQCDE